MATLPNTEQSLLPAIPSVGQLVNQPIELPTLPKLPSKQVVVGGPKTGVNAYDTMNTGKNMINQGIQQQAAAKAQMTTTPEQTMKAMGYTPPTPEQLAKDAADKVLKTLGETPATEPATPEKTALDTLTTNLQTIQTDLETKWNEKQKEIDSINNGTHPLTAIEQAQLDDIRRSYDKMKQDQIEINKRYEGGVKASNVARGLSEFAQYDAEGRMFTAMSAGADKVRAIDAEMTKSVNDLTAAFRKDDLAAIKESYDEYNKLLESRATSIKEIYSATTAFQKTLADQKKQAIEDEYNQVTKPIQDIGLDAAKNNAPPEIRAAIKASKSVDEAIAAAGDWLQTGTGDMALYLQYKRDTQAQGLVPKLFQDWADERQAKETAADISKAYKTAYASAAGKAAGTPIETPTSDVPTLDPTSESIMGQTGLSAGAFAYATQGTTALARMSEKSRTQYMEEWRQYQINHGINGATFRAQYEALNKTVSANVMRNNQAKVAEQELDATVGNLEVAATDADLKKTRLANVAKFFAGQEFNDPALEKYAFHLTQLRNELAMYNAAVAGQIDANGNIREIAKSEMDSIAENTIKTGIAKGGLKGFKDALTASREKMGVVLKQSIAAQDKQVWDLFGVTQPVNAKETVDSYIQANPANAEAVAKLYEVPGATDENIYQYLKQNNLIQ